MTLCESFEAGTDMSVSISDGTYYQMVTMESDHTIAAVSLYLDNGGTSPGIVTVSLRMSEGEMYPGSRPGGQDMVSFAFDGSAIAATPTWYFFPFNKLLHKLSGDVISILLHEEGGLGTISWYGVAAGGYAGGNSGHWDDTCDLWIRDTPDLYFEVHSGFDDELYRRIACLHPATAKILPLRYVQPTY